jgi:hypothetical protein
VTANLAVEGAFDIEQANMAVHDFSASSSARNSLNGGASRFHPSREQSIEHPLTAGSGSEASVGGVFADLVKKVQSLERGQEHLSDHVHHLDNRYTALSQAVAGLSNAARRVAEIDSGVRKTSCENGLSGPASLDGFEEVVKPGGTAKTSPVHARPASGSAASTSYVPPHLRSKGLANSRYAEVKVEDATLPDEEHPDSPTSTLHPDSPRQSVEIPPSVPKSSTEWTPYAVTQFPQLDPLQLASVPSAAETVTFSHDFLANQFGGSFWTPGLKYIPPGPVCMLPTRSYWLLDGSVEPYLPKAPGQHGAKLTAFFNPEEPAGFFDENVKAGSFDNVPMFVCNTPWAEGNARRYMYMGNYSQTRWSDKLDYDRMVEHVPDNVKMYWAEELSATGRAEWVTEALKNHFFPKPTYEGRLPKGPMGGVGSVTDDEDTKYEERVMKDLDVYLKELRHWNEEAELKTRLMSKDFILQSFERVRAISFLSLTVFPFLLYVLWDSPANFT